MKFNKNLNEDGIIFVESYFFMSLMPNNPFQYFFRLLVNFLITNITQIFKRYNKMVKGKLLSVFH